MQIGPFTLHIVSGGDQQRQDLLASVVVDSDPEMTFDEVPLLEFLRHAQICVGSLFGEPRQVLWIPEYDVSVGLTLEPNACISFSVDGRRVGPPLQAFALQAQIARAYEELIGWVRSQ